MRCDNVLQMPILFCNILRQWRKRGKMLQKEAAAILQVPLDTYRAWEYGNREPTEAVPKSEVLRRMTEHHE